MVYKAWLEDPLTTIKILLHCRDCRNGKGERLIILYALIWLRRCKPITYLKNLSNFIKVGYYKDLLNIVKEAELDGQSIMGSEDMIELEVFAEKLIEDEINCDNKNPISLSAKWAPTEKHADDREYEFAKRLAFLIYPDDKVTCSLKKYRLLLKKLRSNINIVENLMSHDRWTEIDYSKVPAKSHLLHTEAFKKHDSERYEKYICDLKEKKTEIKSTGIQPHELVKPFLNGYMKLENEETIQCQWNDMVQKLRETMKMDGILPLCDVSSSMDGEPMNVCIALGLLVSELMTGPFKDMIMTFESEPRLMKIKGVTLSERIHEVSELPWCGSTNLTAAFEQILNNAIMMRCSQEQLPKVLIIFSDMQFNEACENDVSERTVYEDAKKKFEENGYKLPSIIFWNLRSTHNSFPVSMNEQGVVLLSGYSAQLLKLIQEDPLNITPLKMLHDALDPYDNAVVDEREIGAINESLLCDIHEYDHSEYKEFRKNARGTGPGNIKRKYKYNIK